MNIKDTFNIKQQSISLQESFFWYFQPEDYKSNKHKSWSMDAIYSKYGREVFEDTQRALREA